MSSNLNERVSDCCLTQNKQFFSYGMLRTSYIQRNNDDRQTHFIGFL